MIKNNIKTNDKMDELRAIEKSPELTEYIIKTKIKDVKKTALIAGIVAAFITFGLGVYVGMNIVRISSPQNVIEVRVDSNNGEQPIENVEGK